MTQTDTSLPVAAGDNELAETLGLPLLADRPAAALVVERSGGAIQLRDVRPGAPGPIRAEFLDERARRRLREAKRSLLARACGVKPGAPQPRVFDCTAGLGRDAFALACAGCEVVAIERSIVLALMLEDGLRRAAEGGLDEQTGRVKLVRGDAREHLADAEGATIYLDPMFPERRKSAAVKKEMRYLAALLGEESDGAELFKAAAESRRRVVVKRPLHAPRIAATPQPAHTFKGRSVRYDVYLF